LPRHARADPTASDEANEEERKLRRFNMFRSLSKTAPW